MWEVSDHHIIQLTLFSLPQRRCKALAEKGLLFVGSGVSGGEEGARYGPSLMPGGASEAWPAIKPIFQGIAAKANGEPCCDWVSTNWNCGSYILSEMESLFNLCIRTWSGPLYMEALGGMVNAYWFFIFW